MSADQVKALSPTAIGSLTVEQLNSLSPEATSAIDVRWISTSIAKELRVSAGSFLAELNYNARSLTPQVLSLMTADQLNSLSANAVGALNENAISAIAPNVVNQLSATFLNTLSATATESIQTENITASRIKELGNSFGGFLTEIGNNAAQLSDDAVSAMTLEQFNVISSRGAGAISLKRISTDVFNRLSDQFISSIRNNASDLSQKQLIDKLSSLSVYALASLNSDQVNKLTKEQISTIRNKSDTTNLAYLLKTNGLIKKIFAEQESPLNGNAQCLKEFIEKYRTLYQNRNDNPHLRYGEYLGGATEELQYFKSSENPAVTYSIGKSLRVNKYKLYNNFPDFWNSHSEQVSTHVHASSEQTWQAISNALNLTCKEDIRALKKADVSWLIDFSLTLSDQQVIPVTLWLNLDPDMNLEIGGDSKNQQAFLRTIKYTVGAVTNSLESVAQKAVEFISFAPGNWSTTETNNMIDLLYMAGAERIPNLLKSLSLKAVANLDHYAMGKISAQQIMSLSLNQLLAFTGKQIAQVTKDTIRDLGDYIANMTPSQLTRLSSSQVSVISVETWKTITQKTQNAILSSGAGGLTSKHLNLLSVSQIQMLDPEDISVEALSGVKEGVISNFTPKQIWSMSYAQLQAIGKNFVNASELAILGLSPTQISAVESIPGLSLSFSPLLSMNSDQISLVKSDLMQQLDPFVFSNLSERQLFAMTEQQILNLTDMEWYSLTEANREILTKRSQPFAILSDEQVNRLTETQIKLLTLQSVSEITPQRYLNMGRKVEHFTNAQLKSLNSDVVSQILLGQKSSGKLTSEQLKSFSIEQISGLSGVVASHVGSHLTTQLSLEQNKKLAQVSAAKFQNVMANGNSRGVYSIANQIQTFAGSVYYLNIQYRDLYYGREAALSDRKNYNKAMRAIGSGIALSAAVNAFTNAALVGGDKIQQTTYILRGLSVLAASLQVPISSLIDAFRRYENNRMMPGGAQLLTRTDEFLKSSGLTQFFDDLRVQGVNYKAPEPALFNRVLQDGTKTEYLYSGSEIQSLDYLKVNKSSVIKRMAQASSIFFVADVLGIASSTYQAVNAKNDSSAIVNSLNAAIGFGFLVGDAIPVLFTSGGTSLTTAHGALASKVLGGSMLASMALSFGYTLYTDIAAEVEQSSTANRIALYGNAGAGVLQISVVVAGLCIGGPAVALGAAIAGLLLPDFNSIAQAKNLYDLRATLISQGRTTVGEVVVGGLYEIAVLNSIPIVNLASAVYTVKKQDAIRQKMVSGGMNKALEEDLNFSLRQEEASGPNNLIANIQAAIRQSSINNLVDRVLCITLCSADEKSYYANVDSANSTYLSVLDVVKDGWNARVLNLSGSSSNSAIKRSVGVNRLELEFNKKDAGIVCVNIGEQDGAVSGVLLDARKSTQDMQFQLLGKDQVVYGGTGSNIYLIDIGASGYKLIGQAGVTGVAQFTSTKRSLNPLIIDLDRFTEIAVVGSSSVPYNKVTGTKAGQSYRSLGTPDIINLSGGSSQLSVQAGGTQVSLSGGNNLVYASLGFSSASGANQLASFDGGAAVYDSSNYLLENTINFSGSAESLSFNMSGQSGRSLVFTTSGDSDDIARFTNFQNVVGSNHGDRYYLDGCNYVDTLLLGLGANYLSMKNSSGVKIHFSAGSTNTVDISASSCSVYSVKDSSVINVQDGSHVYAQLSGHNDVLNALDNVKGSISATLGSGVHDVFVSDSQVSLVIDSAITGGHTTLHDSVGTRTQAVFVELGKDMTNKFVRSISLNGMDRLEFYSTDGSNQVFTYISDEIEKENKVFIKAMKGPTNMSSAIIGVDLLVQAMASTQGAKDTFGVNGEMYSGYRMSSLLAPASVIAKSH
jgi:hypothetical protein